MIIYIRFRLEESLVYTCLEQLSLFTLWHCASTVDELT